MLVEDRRRRRSLWPSVRVLCELGQRALVDQLGYPLLDRLAAHLVDDVMVLHGGQRNVLPVGTGLDGAQPLEAA